MKDVVLKGTLLGAISLMMVGITQVASAQVVYGLDNASTFNSKHHGPFMVQAGSFLLKQNALQLKSKLSTQLHYPVQISHRQDYYLVVIGPLSSSAEVRKVGGRKMSLPEKHPTVMKADHKSKRLINVPNSMPTQVITNSTTELNGNWYIGADAGLIWSKFNNKMTVNNGSNYPAPENVDLYSMNDHEQTPPMIALSGGYRWQRDQTWIPGYSLGLRYQHLFAQNLTGTIQQYSLAEFNNYTYNWETSADVLSLYSKVDLFQYKRVMPYIDAGIGTSFNNASIYKETALTGVTPRISPSFQSQTQSNFAYNVGAGIDVLLSPQVIVSVGYDYQSYGSMASGNGQSTWSGTQLNLGNLASNTALLSVTYLTDHPFFRSALKN
jgi:opacity protein-like surface antigen